MEVYYEDYRLKVIKNESGNYDIHDSKFGDKITHKNVSKEKTDKRIQEILFVRNRINERRKGIKTMREYNMMGKDIGIVVRASSAAEAMKKAENILLQGYGGYVEFLDEEDAKEYEESEE